ncbi:hypothetical protein FACS1894129_1530 [Actinomycetota bacterium]|nr:hypothetical protein FACS1894129_1530 [Actinomycetota bacterium]
MQVDCAVLGKYVRKINTSHDWDFGYPHLQRLLSKTNFPWLFSNVVDASWRGGEASQMSEKPDENDEQIEATLPYFVFEIKGVRVGCIGLVEKCVHPL